jgi:hypothetical protein
MEKKLNEKLFMFQKNINVIRKDGKNPHFKSSYATLSHILSEVKPVLHDLGLFLTQPVRGNKVLTVITDSETGAEISADIDLPAGLNPQQMGSAITYYRRYLLAGLLALEIEDDDANATNGHTTNGEDARPWLNANTEQFTEAVKHLAAGDVTIERIEKKYKLSKKVRESLISQAV